MSMKALNQLLGLSTIDQRIGEAYYRGDWDKVLRAFDFNPQLREMLSLLEADTFDEYLQAAYLVVAQAEMDNPSPFPSPTYGLRYEGDPQGAKRIA